MASVFPTYLYPRVTDATAAVLLDTGNYEINWSMVQPHEWGHRESIDGNYIKRFYIDVLQKVAPRYYIQQFDRTINSDERVIGFNFKYVGYDKYGLFIYPYFPNPSKDDTNLLKKHQRHFNFKNYDIQHEYMFYDFQCPKNVFHFCPKGMAYLPSAYGSKEFQPGGPGHENYVCGEYTCNHYNSYTFRLYNDTARTKYVDIQ